MASRRLILLVGAFLIVAGSYATLLWLSDTYLLNHSQEPAISARLAAFRDSTTNNSIASTQDDGHDSGWKDALCGGCYHAVAKPDENVRCGLLIHKLMKEEPGLALMDAAESIATSIEYNEPCALCHPDACSKEEKTYWRYDASDRLPPILSSRVPQLASIPSSHKIPAFAVLNLTAFFSMPNNVVPTAHYLFDYNPSIVILPPALLEANQKLSPGSNNDAPVYVASFRVSTQQSCFHPYETKAMYGGSWDHKPPVQDYLALALLRSDLSVIEDVVVDIKASGVFQHFAEDFRLFVLSGQLYVASFDLIAPLQITTTAVGSSAGLVKDGYVLLENVFPSHLQVAIRQFPSCPVCHNRPNKRCGKNLNYFSATDTTGASALVELWPSGPHVVQQVNLQQPCSVARQTEEGSTGLQTFSDAGSRPTTSWHTMEEVMFPKMEPAETILTRGRGGACCISVQNPRTGEQLLVGIYHTKIPKLGKRSGKRLPLWRRGDGGTATIAPNQYLSRWYAFRPTQPYQIVAQSGLFCLGYPGPREQNSHPLVKTTVWKKMIFGGDGVIDTEDYTLVLKCPRIHFVSGIAEKAGAPNGVIVAYGINDCFSRLIEIEKASIINALFSR